ncbi:MAG: hypothetical protein Tsb005_01770 [Gammaproteobacteria bacterium]
MDVDFAPLPNKREHYRVDDDMEISYYLLPGEQTGAEVNIDSHQQQLFKDQFEFQHFKLMQELQKRDRENELLLQSIARQNSSVAEFLEMFDDKFELLVNHLFHATDRQTQKVNISAGGIRFFSKERLPPGGRIKLKLVLRPSFRGVICLGAIVDCKHLPAANSERPYSIGIKFLDLTDTDKQVLTRHIMQKQMEQMREQQATKDTKQR